VQITPLIGVYRISPLDHLLTEDGNYELQVVMTGVADEAGNLGVDTSGIQFQIQAAGVLARHVFYNRSSFDGNNAEANEADDQAIAVDKWPLLPGELAGFGNYTSYVHGINGIMVDVARLADSAQLSVANFEFHVGNTHDPSTWAAGPAPSSVTLRTGAGVDGADRITLIWPDGAIRNQWLQVTVLADDVTGLAAPDVFYFGNAVGETGDVAGDTLVDRWDVAAVAANPRGPDDPALITDPYDFNRDARVDAADVALAETYATDPDTRLRLLDLRDAGLPEVSVSVSPESVLEGGDDVLTYTFTRSGPVDEAAIVTFRVTGTAMYGDDYSVSGAVSFTGQLGTVAFAAGSATAELVVQPTDDILFEGNETVWLLVLPGEDYAVGSPDSARGTIIDDDLALGLQLVVVGTPSAAGSTVLPIGVETVSWGSTYYVEVWVQDRVAPGVGITGGYVDVSYTTDVADAVASSTWTSPCFRTARSTFPVSCGTWAAGHWPVDGGSRPSGLGWATSSSPRHSWLRRRSI
jgi:hypothetical protein